MTQVKPMTTQDMPHDAKPAAHREGDKVSPELEAKAKEIFSSLHGSPTWEAFQGDRETYYTKAREALGQSKGQVDNRQQGRNP